MSIYQRYIIKNLFPPLVMITFLITSLVWIPQILKLLYLIDKGISLSHFFNLIILVLPSLLFILLPFITIFAVIYTYNYLSEKRQLIILQSSGVNNIELAKPALYVAGLITLFAYYISSTSLPLSYRKLKSDLTFLKKHYVANIIDEKTFNQVSKDITIYIDRKLPDGTMKGLVLFDNRNRDNQAILFAKSGMLKIYDNNPVFQLNDGIRQIYDHNGNLTKLSFVTLVVELIGSGSHHLEDNDDRGINEYYIQELLKPDNNLAKQRKVKLIAEAHQRIIWPLYSFVLTFLALAVFLKQPFNKKSHLRQILFTVAPVIIVTTFHFTLQNMATKDLHFVFACYLNIIIAIIVSLYLTLRKTI